MRAYRSAGLGTIARMEDDGSHAIVSAFEAGLGIGVPIQHAYDLPVRVVNAFHGGRSVDSGRGHSECAS